MSTPSSPEITAATYAADGAITAVVAMAGIQQHPDTYGYELRKARRGLDTMDARLAALRQLRILEAKIAVEEQNAVRQLRAEGATWQAIGDALMITRSGAQQKFSE